MILLNMAGLARPARIAANSSRVASTDLSILPSASWRMSLITGGSLVQRCLRGRGLVDVRPGGASTGAHESANPLTSDDAHDGAFVLGAEHDERQLVLHAEGERRRIGDAQALLECVGERDLVVLGGRRAVLGAG